MNTQPRSNAFAATALAAETWTAWRLGERESDAIELDCPATLDEAVRQAIASGPLTPGDTLAVLYTHDGLGKRTLWLHTIRKSANRYSWRAAYDGGKPVKVHALDAKLVCETAVEAFAPVLRFDAFRDDVVGRDLTLVEG
jgi:hypothetical protein